MTLVVKDTAGHCSNPGFQLGARVPEGDIQLNSDDDGVRGESERSARQMPFYGTDSVSSTWDFNKGKVCKDLHAEKLTLSGIYSVYISSSPGANRAKNTLIEIEHAGKKDSVRIDQSRANPLFGWVYVGDFPFSPKFPASVTVSNAGTNGVVIYDAVRWVLKEDRRPKQPQLLPRRPEAPRRKLRIPAFSYTPPLFHATWYIASICSA